MTTLCGPCSRGQHGACDDGFYSPCDCDWNGHGEPTTEREAAERAAAAERVRAFLDARAKMRGSNIDPTQIHSVGVGGEVFDLLTADLHALLAPPAPDQQAVAAEWWPCDNYTEPVTCLTARASETGMCRVCRMRGADRLIAALTESDLTERMEELAARVDRVGPTAALWVADEIRAALAARTNPSDTAEGES